MPSKALLYAAEVLHLARQGHTWGLKVSSVRFDWSRVMQRKARMIEGFADYRRQQLASGKFKFIRANVHFIDSHSLQLQRERWHLSGKIPGTLTSKHFIIATGSSVAAPPLPSLKEVGFSTSDDLLSLMNLPKSLIVLGGGAIACELAQFLARFDVRVTMIQRSSHILKEFDADAAAAIEDVLRREGIQLFTGTRLLGARRLGKRKAVVFEHAGKAKQVQAEQILVALGRSPATTSLHLTNAGVEEDNDRIITNGRMQTSAPHIFAAGDCTGPHEIVHIAIQQAEIAAHNIANPRRPRALDYRLLTKVVFTDPQVATVGLTEKAAAAGKIPFLAASYPFNGHGKSLIMEALDGFVKLLANPKTGEILGGSCVGPVGGELIHEITAAMAKRMTVHELAAIPHYHPTLAEIWTYPAEDLAERIPRHGRVHSISDWRATCRHNHHAGPLV